MLSYSKKSDIVGLYNGGLSVKEIAKGIGISQTTVYYVLKIEKVELRKSIREDLRGKPSCYHGPTGVKREELKKMYEGGMGIRQIAQKIGCRQRSVTERLKRMGCEIRKGDERRVPVEKIVELYNKGLGMERIAHKFGYKSSESIRKTLRKAGIPVRKSWRFLNCKPVLENEYIRILNPTHPRSLKDGRVPEHLLVAEKYLGKPIPKGWVIHHVNGNKKDNRPENLLVMSKQDHANVIPFLFRRINILEQALHTLLGIK